MIPTLNINAVNLRVPMPGHYVADDQIDKVFEDLMQVEDLIKNHDIVFNVFDTREARYFPTVICGLFGVLCVSIGIGYDSFVNVIHGKSDVYY